MLNGCVFFSLLVNSGVFIFGEYHWDYFTQGLSCCCPCLFEEEFDKGNVSCGHRDLFIFTNQNVTL